MSNLRPFTVLRIDSTARQEGSYSRPLADRLIDGLRERVPGLDLIERDLTANPPPVVNADWFKAAYTADEEKTDNDRLALEASDELVEEFARADAFVITAPIYNFSVSAQLKLWIDQVARFGKTFTYTENGPMGVLPDRPVYLVITSGGTEIGSDIDFASGYLRHVLGFVGLTQVEIIGADKLMSLADEKLPAAEKLIDELVAAFDPV